MNWATLNVVVIKSVSAKQSERSNRHLLWLVSFSSEERIVCLNLE